MSIIALPKRFGWLYIALLVPNGVIPDQVPNRKKKYGREIDVASRLEPSTVLTSSHVMVS